VDSSQVGTSHFALQIWPPLSSDPMGFRLRRSARLGPLRFNVSGAGLLSRALQHHWAWIVDRSSLIRRSA